MGEELMRFKEFFLRQEGPGKEEIKKNLDLLDEENFEDVFWTLEPGEQIYFRRDPDTEYEELVRYMAFIKTYNRYWDAVSGRTTFDGRTQCLILSENSSLTELNLDINALSTLQSSDIRTFKDLYKTIFDPGQEIIDVELLSICKTAFEILSENSKIRMDFSFVV